MQKIVTAIVAIVVLILIYLYVRFKKIQNEIESSLTIEGLTTQGLIVNFKVSDNLVKKMDIVQSANLVSSKVCEQGTCVVTIRIISLEDLEVYFYGKNTFFRINLKEIIKNKLENE